MTKYIYDENTLELKEVKQKYLAKSIKFILVLFILMLKQENLKFIQKISKRSLINFM